jgi:hypothetical protein
MRNRSGGPPAGKPWCWYSREMLLSPAFVGGSINCRRLLNALEVENMNHAGKENGKLVMPYNQLQRTWRIPRRLIRPAIDEAIERGLLREERGLRLCYPKTAPNTYRLTYRPTFEGTPPRAVPPTNEWQQYRDQKTDHKDHK